MKDHIKTIKAIRRSGFRYRRVITLRFLNKWSRFRETSKSLMGF